MNKLIGKRLIEHRQLFDFFLLLLQLLMFLLLLDGVLAEKDLFFGNFNRTLRFFLWPTKLRHNRIAVVNAIDQH